jgi:hypothetical protein
VYRESETSKVPDLETHSIRVFSKSRPVRKIDYTSPTRLYRRYEIIRGRRGKILQNEIEAQKKIYSQKVTDKAEKEKKGRFIKHEQCGK